MGSHPWTSSLPRTAPMSPLLLIALASVPAVFMQDACCRVKTVKGSGDLAGMYLLSRDEPTDRPADCMDKCVYEKDGSSSYYCFQAGGGMFSECGADNMEATTANPPGGGGDGGAPAASNKEYCDTSSDHTMCKYPGPSAECAAKTTGKAFTPAGKKLILDKHNELRRKVAKGEETEVNAQPKASNMREMVWSDELAAIAQRWADQCEFGHDANRKKLDGTYVGQNAYMSSSSRESDLDAIMAKMDGAAKAWYSEVTEYSFNPTDIKPFKFGYQTGHYTQVVWAESEELGCGQVMFKDGDWYKNIVVCNYAKGGNMQGGTMYEEGEPCSACSDGYSCKESLCAKN